MKKIIIWIALCIFFIPLVLGATVDIDASTEYQTIDGFGGSESWRLPKTDDMLSTLFDDLGVSVLRFQMFAYTESDPDVIGDKARDNDNNDPFTIDWGGVDTNFIDAYAYLLQGAQSRGVKIIGTTWSPPAWMKESPYVENSSLFVPGNEDELVEFILIWVQGMEQRHGIHIDSVTIQNEPDNLPPWPGCKYSSAQITDIVKRLGARFAAEGVTTEIHAPDSTHLGSTYNNYVGSICNDPVAKGYVDVLATHPYGSEFYPVDDAIPNWISAANTASSCGKRLWQTEFAGLSNENTWIHAFNQIQHLHNALFYGKVSVFTTYELYDNRDGNYGTIDLGGPHPKFYTLKQYYKYIRPGAIMVDTSSNDGDVLVTSFKHNSDNTFTIVAINRKTSSESVDFNINNLNSISSLDVYRTTVSEDSVSLGQVSVTGNSFTYNLPAESVTTFTGTLSSSPPACSDLGGSCCQAGETCSGSTQVTTDCNDCCTSGTCQTPPPPGAVAFYHFDESSGTSVSDSSGNGNTGNLLGGEWISNGLTNRALYFDGLDDYVSVPSSSDINFGTNDFSVSFWFKTNTAPLTYTSILYKATPRTGSPGYGFLLRETGGNLKFTIGDGTTVVEARGPQIPDTNWHHVVGIRGGGQVSLYLDNALVAQGTDAVGSVDNTEPLRIGMGGYGNNPGGAYAALYFDGTIDELEIYDKALSLTEIDQIYQTGLNNYNNPPTITLTSPSDGSIDMPTSTILQSTVTDQENDLMDVTFYGGSPGSATSEPDFFTIIAIPDTQYYSDYMPDRFTAQTQWIVNNKNALNIVFVSHEGDIVEHGDDLSEWDNANTSMSILDGVVPYGLAYGNHDTDPNTGDTINYNTYFPYTRYENYPWYGGHYGTNNDNNYQLFSTSGEDYIIIHLEYYPSTAALNWADGILKTYSNRRAIVTSHSVINQDGSWRAEGLNLFNALSDNSNLFLILCGHRIGGGARRVDVVNGREIHTLLADYQSMGTPQNGEGYLRIMTFVPKENKIYVKTYSPVLNNYRTVGEDQFSLDYPMVNYATIGTRTNVQSGSSQSMAWSGLANGTRYYWYANAVDDTSKTAQSFVWGFTTLGTACNVAGDVDGDCSVSLDDLILVAIDFGKKTGFNSRADVNYDQVIDIFDIVYVARRIT